MEFWATVIASIIVGAIVGGVARILIPGAQRIGIVMTILAGAVAAYLGQFIGESMGLGEGDGFSWPILGIQVLLAALVIGVIGGVGRQR